MNDRCPMDIQESLVRHLCLQGLDEQLARVFTDAIVDHALTWQVKSSSAADDCNAIMAIAFGYQLSAKGSRKPGLANESLATTVLNHYRRKPRPVYAQSEIAVLLGSDLPARHFHPVKPRKSANDSRSCTSTELVVAEIAREVGEPESLAPWLLIAHRHHALRCSVIAEEKGFGCVVTPELPAVYDRQSAHIWRRRHLAYLVSDVVSRLTMYATKRLYPAIIQAESARQLDRKDAEPIDEDRPLAVPPSLADTTEDRPLAVPPSLAASSKDSFQDQLNGDVRLLGSDEDYAAIPCYRPQQAATPPALPQQPAAEQRRGDWRDVARGKPSRKDTPSSASVPSPGAVSV
jgi:hypothetical protein